MLIHTLTQTTEILPRRSVANPYKLPLTITLRSIDLNRAVQISTDGGVNYITPTLDYDTTEEIILIIHAPVTDVKVTGAIGDTLIILENRQ